jgi:DNA replication initiation complex subunit (GINS family)
MKDDYDIMFESFVGEHLENIQDMRRYHNLVLQALADQNYEQIGKLVEEAMGAFNQKTVAYIEEHKSQMEMRNV